MLGPVSEGQGLLAFDLGSDGSGGELLKVEAGGSRLPASEQTVKENKHVISMNGREVFKFAVRAINSSTETVLGKAGMTKNDIDFLVPHQANIRIIESAMKRFGLSKDKVVVNIDRYGNMSSASIPIALSEAYENRLFQLGDKLVLCGFGGGLTWGAAVITWTIE